MTTNTSKNAHFTDPVRDKAKKEVQTIIIKILTQISLKITESVSEYINEVYSSSKNRRLKYKEIASILANSNSSFKELQTAIQETEFIIKLTKFEMDNLNKINPLNLIKSQLLSQRYSKWLSLQNAINTEAIDRSQKEMVKSSTTKEETAFFSDYPQLQCEILKVNSQEVIESLSLNIKTEM